MAIYMKFGDIKGQVTTEGFKDWIELTSFSKGISRSVGSGGGGKTREGSEPAVSDITVTKVTDAASAKLLQDSLSGNFDTTVKINFTSTSKNKVDTYLAYELSKCGISNFSLGSSGDNPSESLTLNFTKFMVSPSPLDASGTPKAGDKVTHDLTTSVTS